MRALLFAGLFIFVSTTAHSQSRLCEEPQKQCGDLVDPRCLERLGAGSLAADTPAICTAQLKVYQGCLSLVTENCPKYSPKPQAPDLPNNAGERIVAGKLAAQMIECRNDGKNLFCIFLVTAIGSSDVKTLINAYESRVTFSSGQSRNGENVYRGKSNSRGSVKIRFPMKIPTRISVSFPEPPTDAKNISAVELFTDHEEGKKFRWYNIEAN